MKIIKYITICFLVGFFYSCECVDDEELIIEEAPNPFILEDMYADGEIVLIFNKNVDPSSVVTGESILINGDAIEVLGDAEVDDNEIFIDFCSIACPNSECEIEITLKGEANNGIKSVGGQVLDGDIDGSDGGDQVENISFPSCNVPQVITAPQSGSSRFVYSVSGLDGYSTFIEFNQPMDPETIDENSLILKTETGISTYYFTDWNEDYTGFTLEAYPECYDTPTPCECNLTITLKGDLIYSADGLRLDGDYDYKEGGDFSTYETFIGLAHAFKGFFGISPYKRYGVTGNLDLKVAFTLPIDANSVIPKENLILYNFESEIPFTVSWEDEQNLILHIQYGDYSSKEGDVEFTIYGLGDGDDPIIDSCGENAIDGNEDVSPGGEFEIEYSIPICNLILC